MGCNESKSDVVTGNTVKTPPPPARKNFNNISVKKSMDLEVIPEITDDVNITAATTNSSPSLSSPSSSSLKSNDNKTELAVATDNNPILTSKDINTVNAEHVQHQQLKEDSPVVKSADDDSLNGVLTKEDNIVNERHQRRLSGSSDHYFSSRKDEAAVKAIIAAAAAADIEKEDVVEEFVAQDDDDQSTKLVSNHDNQEEKIKTGLNEETKEKGADDKNIIKNGTDGGDLNNVKSSEACLPEQELSEEPEVVTTMTPTVDQEKESPLTTAKNSTTTSETTQGFKNSSGCIHN
ncbi:hypothetical protein MKX01_023098 [Papaver californicum]|nr:hypothetical protein MKX01_023098 [Papaver californicum]